MPDTQRAPRGTDETSRGIGKFLAKPWWVGIGVFVAVLGVIAAILVPLLTASSPPDQHPTQSTSAGPVRFSDLSQITIRRYGLIFFYPSGWDQQYLPTNRDGAEFVNPDDKAVSVKGYGTHGDLPPSPTIFDVQKWCDSYILSLRNARIIETTATGTTAEDAQGKYPVDAWRVVYQYVDDHGHSMTDMVKTAYANSREVDLVMEAPTREFSRYKEAFLQLSDKLLLLIQCEECYAQ